MELFIYIYKHIEIIVIMKKLFPLVFLVPLLFSCDKFIDNNYDLAKLDSEVTVAGGFTVSVPNKKLSLALGDILDGSGLIVADAEGNYSIKMDLGQKNFNFSVPQFSLPALTVPMEIAFKDIDPGIPGPDVMLTDQSYEESSTGSSVFTIENTAVPEEITAVEYASMNGVATLNLKPNTLAGAKYTLLKGTTISFPDITGVSCTDPNFSSGSGLIKNSLTLNNDIDITPGLELKFSYQHIQINSPNGIVAPSHLKIDTECAYNAKIKITYTGMLSAIVGYAPSLDGSVALDATMLTEANVKIAKKETLDNLPNVSMGTLPDALSGSNSKLDLDDLNIMIDVNSSLPASFKLKGAITPLSADGKATKEITVGPLDIVKGQNNLKINESNCPGISDIFIPVPASVKFKNLYADVYTPEGAISTINFGSDYSASAKFSIDSPLAFGPNAFMDNIEYKLDDLGFSGDSNISFSEATMQLKYSNTIPLNFLMKASAVSATGVAIEITDKDGNSLESNPLPIEYSEDGQKTAEIKIKGDKIKISDFSGINFIFSAASSEALKGKQLNKSQAIQIGDFKLIIDSGITLGGKNN